LIKHIHFWNFGTDIADKLLPTVSLQVQYKKNLTIATTNARSYWTQKYMYSLYSY